ncbi:hypothetical protein K491DRAFT_709773 [Lophiostoma macrostomum CBS 122681]|uniref:Uncharacterized protein n=1 Tax=Lophiostoma macrostomum CBS 122681 TaxID=1314788 RepID=A0A6A6TTX1_9PLEO|nr:hypothetical protein K491DRAFT_709773 [Lophiostoma macrostomum CBS 122681]
MSDGPGGILTPPASSVAASAIPPLPRPRRHPLKPGGPKESELIHYLDQGINKVQKRVDNRISKERKKRNSATGTAASVAGYDSFGEVEQDLEGLVDVIWVSGSPNLQIPYLLSIARMVSEYLPLFPFAPHATLRLLGKLDSAFFSLLQGKDTDTGDPLPGFENGWGISTTDKVRLKGIVDCTRVVVVRSLGRENVDEEGEPVDTEDEQMTESGPEDTVKFEGFENDDDDDEEEWTEIQIGKVYERTIGELGDELRGPPIGIITEE